MAINPDLLKPFVKISIRDLVRSRLDEIQMVWIQGTLMLVENNVIELKDSHGESIRVTLCPNIQKPTNGKYYQVLGYFEGKKTVRAVKVVEIESLILQEMWPFEVQEMGSLSK